MQKNLVFFVLIFGQSLFAAIPKQVEKKADVGALAEEILTMPEKNRFAVAEKKADELFPVLITLSQSEKKSMQTRWKALTLAAHLKKGQAMPELEKALKSKEWFMRNAGLVAIQSFNAPKAMKAAKDLLKDKALVVRSAAVEVIGSQKELGPETRDLLWEEMNASYNFRQKQGLWVREQILEKLAQSPEKKEMPLFLKALREEPKMHASAIVAMEKLADTKLGKANSTTDQKRQLWIQWAKNNAHTLL